MELTIAPPPPAAPPENARRDPWPDLLWLGALVVLLALDFRTITTLPVHHDIAWPLYLARRMLGGARLYVDIIEVHPPLVIWWATLASLVSRVLGVSDIAAYHGLSLVAVAASVTLGWVLLRRLLPEAPWARATLLVLQAFLLLPFVRYSLGQEEHLMLTLTWPYLLAVALAARGEEVGRWRWWIGALAGVGFAMKPLYVLTWLALEVYAARSRRSWRPRAEAVAVAIVLAAYPLAVIVFTPAYFRMLTWAAAAYGYYFTAPLFRVVLVPQTYLVVCALLADLLPRDPRTGTLRRVAALTLVACTLVVYGQHRGWTYHWYPALALALYLMGITALEQFAALRRRAAGLRPAVAPGDGDRFVPAAATRADALQLALVPGVGPVGSDLVRPAPAEAVELGSSPGRQAGSDAVGLAVARARVPRWLSPALATGALTLGLLVGGGFMLAGTRRQFRDLNVPPYYLPGMRYIVQAFGRGGPIMTISDIMQPAFPLVNYTGVPYASRFSCLWMLPGLYAHEWTAGVPFPYHDAQRTSPLERYMIDAVIEDIQRHQPTLLIFDRDPPFMLPGFSYFVYFSRDARFRALMAHYERLARMQRYMIFRRMD